MNTTSRYKKRLYEAEHIQKLWIPVVGDFWACACTSCLNRDFAWVIEVADVLAIDETANLDNWYRDTRLAAMTSRDCGFGAFWLHRHEENALGYVWLPRLDQLLDYIDSLLKTLKSEQTALEGLSKWKKAFGSNLTIEEAAINYIEYLEYVNGQTNHTKAV